MRLKRFDVSILKAGQLTPVGVWSHSLQLVIDWHKYDKQLQVQNRQSLSERLRKRGLSRRDKAKNSKNGKYSHFQPKEPQEGHGRASNSPRTSWQLNISNWSAFQTWEHRIWNRQSLFAKEAYLGEIRRKTAKTANTVIFSQKSHRKGQYLSKN